MVTGLNDACKEHHYAMRNKGFWDSEDKLNALETNSVITYDDYNDFDNGLLCTRLALVGTEISEAIEAVRKGNLGLLEKDTLEDELADTFLRLMDVVGGLGIDIEAQLIWKSNLNKERGYKHGKLF